MYDCAVLEIGTAAKLRYTFELFQRKALYKYVLLLLTRRLYIITTISIYLRKCIHLCRNHEMLNCITTIARVKFAYSGQCVPS